MKQGRWHDWDSVGMDGMGQGGGVSSNGPSNEARDKFLSHSKSSFPKGSMPQV